MSTHPFLAALSLFTLIAVVAYGLWEYRSVRRHQRRRNEPTGTLSHEHFTADADLAPDGVASDAATAVRLPEPVGAAATRASRLPDA